jgi:hypothetical protein
MLSWAISISPLSNFKIEGPKRITRHLGREPWKNLVRAK